jgi:hypothetical protein
VKTFRITLLALASTIALYACGGNTTSSADTGVTQAQVQSMIAAAIAPLQQQINSMQPSASPAVFIKAPNAPAVKVASQMHGDKSQSAPPSCTGLGTLTGRPSTSDPIASNLISGISCTGYYYTISGAATSAQQAVVQPLSGALTVWFDSPNCQGNAYVSLNSGNQSVSPGAVANGAVFTVAGAYWMLKPGTAVSDPAILSSYQSGQCSAFSGSWDMYQLAPNDQTVSGVPSAPIPGPVTIG